MPGGLGRILRWGVPSAMGAGAGLGAVLDWLERRPSPDAPDPREGRPVIDLDTASYDPGSPAAPPAFPDYRLSGEAPSSRIDQDKLRAAMMQGPVLTMTDPEGRRLRSLFIATEKAPLRLGEAESLASILTGKPEYFDAMEKDGHLTWPAFHDMPLMGSAGAYNAATNDIMVQSPQAYWALYRWLGLDKAHEIEEEEARSLGTPEPPPPRPYDPRGTIVHESMHAIDNHLRGTFDPWGVTAALFAGKSAAKVQSELKSLWGESSTEWQHGIGDGPEEWTAEAVADYMEDPAAFKKKAPFTAARLRKIINENPKINWLLTLARNETPRMTGIS